MIDDDTIDLSKLFRMVLKHKKTILILAITGLVVGAMITGFLYLKSERTPRHVITCSFAVVATNSNGNYGANGTSPGYYDVKLAEDVAESVIFVTESDRVLSDAIEQKRFLGISNDDIRKHMTVEQYGDTQIVQLKLKWINANEGLNIVQAICDVTPNILIDTLNLGSVSVIDYPKDSGIEAPEIHFEYILYMILLLVGLYLVHIFIEFNLHPTINDVDSVQTDLNGLENLGVIPENGAYFSNRPFSIDAEYDDFFEVRNAFVSTAYIISNIVKREKKKIFYITSSESGEGKTGVVANLAIELSKRDHKVLVVDLDVKRPALGSCFFEKIRHEQSLNAVYEGSVLLQDAVISITENLNLLATRLEKNSISVNNMLREQLEKFFVNYDVVLLDAPPIGVVSDAAALNPIADQAIMVIKFDNVWVQTINHNIEKLKATGIEVCGTILTNVKTYHGADYYTYHNSYQTYNGYNNSVDCKPKKEKRSFIRKKK